MLGERIHHAPDAAPVDGAGAHGARLGARIERRTGQCFRRSCACSQLRGAQLCMLRWVTIGRQAVVARFGDYGAVGRNHQRGKRVLALLA